LHSSNYGQNDSWLAAVLAAGEGSRFGGAKLTALFDGKPLVHWPVEAALASGMVGVLVVVGFNASQVRQALPKDSRVEVIENPTPEEGMGGSLALAARRAEARGASGLVMLLGDMPFVTAQSIDRLAGVAQKAEQGAAAGVVDGKRNHPVAFSRRYFKELASLGGDKGARDVLARLGEGLTLVEVPPETRIDIDKPEELNRALEIWKKLKGR
jgi:molybdenum cofactor cytidylyltransferase